MTAPPSLALQWSCLSCVCCTPSIMMENETLWVLRKISVKMIIARNSPWEEKLLCIVLTYWLANIWSFYWIFIATLEINCIVLFLKDYTSHFFHTHTPSSIITTKQIMYCNSFCLFNLIYLINFHNEQFLNNIHLHTCKTWGHYTSMLRFWKPLIQETKWLQRLL